MKSARKKRNGAAPGMNALSYVPYKKCSSIIKFLAKLGRKIWKSRDIPVDWAMAYIILLPKSENLTLVSEFRPIAIACCAGKIFFLLYQIDFKFLYFVTTTSLKRSRKVSLQECLVVLNTLLLY